jgi:hypothetical protein
VAVVEEVDMGVVVVRVQGLGPIETQSTTKIHMETGKYLLFKVHLMKLMAENLLKGVVAMVTPWFFPWWSPWWFQQWGRGR